MADEIGALAGLGQYDPNVTTMPSMSKQLKQPTAREVLVFRKNEYLKQIEKIDKAIAALDANPGVEGVLNTLRDVGI